MRLEVIRDIEKAKKIINPIVTIGAFDGIHRGHQKIIQQVNDLAQKHQGKSVLLSFWPHPRTILAPHKGIELLSSLDEKISLLKRFELDYLILTPFTQEFSEMDRSEFVERFLIKHLRTNELVIGYDHRFGKNRTGDIEYLKSNSGTFPFLITEIAREDIDESAISSTRIRTALKAGFIQEANDLLGHPFSITGTVTTGDKIGRTINFPTANIQIDEDFKLIPKNGVYSIHATVEEKTLKGMLNIGYRPTLNGIDRTIEAHFFDFEGDLYNRKIQLFLHTRLREEEKFISLEALQFQLRKDKKQALADLQNEKF